MPNLLKKQNKTKFEKAKNNCFCGAKTTLIYSLVIALFAVTYEKSKSAGQRGAKYRSEV